MFFRERIVSIKPGDHVLEVGPGGTPFARSDVFLERVFDDPESAARQRGLVPPLQSHKQTVYYQGTRFPFNDKEFDYVICSHVLEHVEDVEAFTRELARVGQRGYLEYPNVYYDYIYNFRVHQNFLHRQKVRSSRRFSSPLGIFLRFLVGRPRGTHSRYEAILFRGFRMVWLY